MLTLDEDLIALTRRAPRDGDGLDHDQAMAINVLWRRGVKATVLARVFGVSKNTVYYRALTGLAQSYPARTAVEVNAKIDAMGLEAAERKYVQPWMVEAVNAELAKIASGIRNRKRKA